MAGRTGAWPKGGPAGRLRAGLGAGLLLAAGACAPAVDEAPAPAPAPQAQPEAPPPQRAARDPGIEVRAHFARQEETLRARGLMRTDTAPADVPFGVATLVRNFDRIALRDEYVIEGQRIVARESPARLRRWETPVRVALSFGDAVPGRQRAADTALVSAYIARLAEITGHPIRMVDTVEAANFRVLVLTEAERRAHGPRLRALVPGIDDLTVETITGLPLSASCLVVTFARGSSHVYSQAVAVVRAELPELTRTSCFHEEIAQGLGLPNDSAAARPSIFNDVQEFALLTTHDAALLRILYDRRLRPGMTPAEARPLVEVIASELLAGES